MPAIIDNTSSFSSNSSPLSSVIVEFSKSNLRSVSLKIKSFEWISITT
jgi:hypothetical protein